MTSGKYVPVMASDFVPMASELFSLSLLSPKTLATLYGSGELTPVVIPWP